jgi:hypothetical protein
MLKKHNKSGVHKSQLPGHIGTFHMVMPNTVSVVTAAPHS